MSAIDAQDIIEVDPDTKEMLKMLVSGHDSLTYGQSLYGLTQILTKMKISPDHNMNGCFILQDMQNIPGLQVTQPIPPGGFRTPRV